MHFFKSHYASDGVYIPTHSDVLENLHVIISEEENTERRLNQQLLKE
jgi:hypothetical protein